MRSARLLLGAAVALALAAPIALAQDTAPPDGKRPRRERPPRTDRQRGPSLEKALEGMSLTEVQRAQVTALWNTYQQDVRNWQSENAAALKEVYDKLTKAREAGDNDANRAAREEMAKLNAPRLAKQAELEKQLKGTLTEEQAMNLLIAMRLRRPPRLGEDVQVLVGRFRELKLAPEQEEKVKKILKDAYVAIVEGILTVEQREVLKKPPERPARPARSSERRPAAN